MTVCVWLDSRGSPLMSTKFIQYIVYGAYHKTSAHSKDADMHMNVCMCL